MNEGKPYLLFVNLLTTGNNPEINLGRVMGQAALFIGKKERTTGLENESEWTYNVCL